jgi:hypothetical protein
MYGIRMGGNGMTQAEYNALCIAADARARQELGKGDLIMAELSEQQIEQAARAMHEAGTVSIHFWEHVFAGDKERYRKAARAAAPYLQLPWDEPLRGELDTIFNAMPRTDPSVFAVVCAFVRRRNAAIQPKPVDSRFEKVKAILNCRFYMGNPEFDKFADEVVPEILAAIDKPDCLGCGENNGHKWNCPTLRSHDEVK